MILSHIVAAAKNGVIGTQNSLPWELPEDMKFFREKTKGHIMIMGRKTYDSFGGKPLPQRFHIVITRHETQSAFPNVVYVKSIPEALEKARTVLKQYPEEVFIIGGGEIYSQTMNIVDRIYLTRIDKDFDGDAIYPMIPQSDFSLEEKKDRQDPIPFSFLTYKRIKSQ